MAEVRELCRAWNGDCGSTGIGDPEFDTIGEHDGSPQTHGFEAVVVTAQAVQVGVDGPASRRWVAMEIRDDVVDLALLGRDIAAWVSTGAIAVSNTFCECSSGPIVECSGWWQRQATVPVCVQREPKGGICCDGRFEFGNEGVGAAIRRGDTAASWWLC